MTEGAIRIVHQTSHLFPRPVEVGEIEVCLEPLGASFHQVVVTPIAAEESRWHDAFGNPRKRLLVRGPFERLEVTAVSTVPRRPDGAWRERFASLVSRDGLVAPSPRVPHLVATRDFAREVLVGATLRERLVSFVEALARSATFDTAATDVDTPLERFVATRRGVCQDFAHFTLACLRSQGIPAAYLGGYHARLTQAGRSHAWVAAHDAAQDAWIALDPTLGTLDADDHVVVAVGRDYDDVPPLSGVLAYEGTCRTVSRVRVEATT